MEFPDLGKHCSETTCHQLDFLPVQCDACQKIYCSTHYPYTQHHCPEAYKKDNQVPVCPLCNAPIPIRKGESADEIVGRHIDSDCQSETALTRRKVFSNRCAVKGCKQKELMPLMCDKCRLNHCLRHRHEADHNCQGTRTAAASAGAAAAARAQAAAKSTPAAAATSNKTAAHRGADAVRQRSADSSRGTAAVQQPRAITVNALQQPGISEEEAIRRAIELSLQPNQQSANTPASAAQTAQELADAALARALHESELEARAASANARRPVEPTGNRSCSMS